MSGTALVLALIAGYIFAVLIRSFVSDPITEYQFWILWLVNANLLYQAIEEHLYKFHYFIDVRFHKAGRNSGQNIKDCVEEPVQPDTETGK